ncbi:MAG: hypothetical protein P4L03_07570 [Terracidiphilus sp.]|nr:hypothetical protein [Terracidiphilus sp.]
MKTHPYLRAYLSGVLVPTLVLPLLLAVFIVARLVLCVPVPIEQAMIFPMSVVPLLFGLWNMLWLVSHERTHLVIGVHGALLPCVLMPAGATTAHCLGVLKLTSNEAVWFNAAHVSYAVIVPMFLVALAAYYLVWKYIVGFVNRELGIA